LSWWLVCVQATNKLLLHVQRLQLKFLLFDAAGVGSSDPPRNSSYGSNLLVTLLKISDFTIKSFALCSLSEQGGHAAISACSR
jgi:hypothetical protein